ncbi:putative selenate reductase subunit YgfK [Ruminococcaceae bacterium OttesenSCG-928-I18]|nr:putative selenate reductase subunit YgfK [Ruminococcaceae bacterium OttesenSCG-928-I18]
MGELMRPMPFDQLMRWALTEYKGKKSIYGIREEKFYQPLNDTLEIFGSKISTPVGPAAGPNSQLAQNIVAAYLAGGRFFELKTVQKMDGDELRACVPRPCINAQDEGYNVEWSTELTVGQAFEEYVKAWVALHALGAELGLSHGCDFVLNMSVGYDLAGIQTDKIDRYIEGMKNAADTEVFLQCVGWLREHRALFERMKPEDIEAISPQVSHSVTLSTLHGCPPEEIERITKYLLREKGLHTFIKCNPTLLGYSEARRLLDQTGYTYIGFDEHHFQDDLQYGDAVQMVKRLQNIAQDNNLDFGVKITNTFPVQIQKSELPGEEMYMSGRALLPLSIHVAEKLSRDFNGCLPISYSGGADAFNLEDILKTGIKPVTVATTILKPGGYERLHQLAALAQPHLSALPSTIQPEALSLLAEKLLSDPFYQKENRPVESRKTTLPLGLFDCFQAPCKQGGCPIEQQIPEYLRLVAKERYSEAFRVIAVDNALPGMTGAICNHPCQGKCTRLDYDHPLSIRQAKHLATRQAQKDFIETMKPAPLQPGVKVAVVGAGPAGIAAAHYLRRNGVEVSVFEKRDKPFGVVEYVIPSFRLSPDILKQDFEMTARMGVDFHFNTPIENPAALLDTYDYVVLAVGAWKEGAPAVREGGENILDALHFLEESKRDAKGVALGKTVAVVGGGDVAMDCARTAIRMQGVEKVVLVYRRTRTFMPAEKEEIRLAAEEGVEMVELHAPLRYDKKTLCCEKMQLGEWDESGRRGIKGTGEEIQLAFDSVICATGARVDPTLFQKAGLDLDDRNRPLLNESLESSVPGLYVAGDCRRGPATIVAAMADAKAITKDILHKKGLADDFARVEQPVETEVLQARKGILQKAEEGPGDADRCLGCDTLCEICCDVCPNRANLSLPIPGFKNLSQILHVDGLCNECGNCGVFCPHSGDPYKDKITLFWTREDFADSKNLGFLKTREKQYVMRIDEDKTIECDLTDTRVPKEWVSLIQFVETHLPYVFG